MLTSEAARNQQEQRAALCNDKLTAEEALSASQRLDALEVSINEATNLCLDGFNDFGFWSSAAESGWSKDPTLYDERTHSTIKVLRKKWLGIFGRLVGLLDAARGTCRAKREGDARKCFQVMLSIERMDQAEASDSLIREADSALREYVERSGE